MKHPFTALGPEYAGLLTRVQITKQAAATSAAKRLLRDKDAYVGVESATGVPAVWLMATNERESTGRLTTYLGNGQSLKMRTTIVPKGRGPFLGPNAWRDGAIDALQLNGTADVAVWDWPRMCFEWEAYNGFGYRDHHAIRTPYLWGGTNLQQKGKYTSDGKYSSTTTDPQLGTVAIAKAIIALDLTLELAKVNRAPPIVPIETENKLPIPSGIDRVFWLQASLNKLGQKPPIGVDGSYGNETRMAVRAFQQKHGGIKVDGWAGDVETIPAIIADLAKLSA